MAHGRHTSALSSKKLESELPLSLLPQLPSRLEMLKRIQAEKEELAAMRADPLNIDPDAEARK